MECASQEDLRAERPIVEDLSASTLESEPLCDSLSLGITEEILPQRREDHLGLGQLARVAQRSELVRPSVCSYGVLGAGFSRALPCYDSGLSHKHGSHVTTRRVQVNVMAGRSKVQPRHKACLSETSCTFRLPMGVRMELVN